MIDIGKRITNLCEERDISMNKLAKLSDLPPSTVKNIVYGNSQNPGIVTISSICKGLDITLVDFFTEK